MIEFIMNGGADIAINPALVTMVIDCSDKNLTLVCFGLAAAGEV